MDKKLSRGNTIFNNGFDIQQAINNCGGDGTNAIPAPLSSTVMKQKTKRNTSYIANAGNAIKNNNYKSKTASNNIIVSNNTNNNNNNNHNTHGGGGGATTNNRTALTEVAAAAAANITTQQKQPISPVNAKTTMATVRMKNEEAVNDLRQRIPEIEKIFDVHTRIGNGTFSTVLLGTLRKERHLPEENRRKFAIKHHIPTSHPERIMRELQCMASIGGVDNVVGINCCMRCNESVAFIMPYMPHDRFHDFFNKMDLAEVQYYMKNLLQALRRVHRFNIIHRDVKPSNFLYNRSKRQFLLVDFGLAQQAPSTQKNIEAASMNAIKSARISSGGGEGNKRAREHDADEDNDGTLKSCLDTGSETTVTDTKNGDTTTTTLVSGVPKRLRCSGPQGDQQVAAVGNTKTASGGSNAQTRSDNAATFKMPLKQLNEITAPNGKMLTVTAISNTGNNLIPTTTAQTMSTGASVAGDAAKYNTNRNISAMNAAKCFCYGNAQVCNICLIKKEIHASRAGTPGYRPPEVLLKYADQTTAVDIWAAGVIFLSVLSSVYPFFKAPNDFVALAEMVTIFGDKSIRNTACLLDRLVTLSQHSKPLDLRKLCVRFRNRTKFSSPEMLKKHQNTDGTCEVCKNCDQYFFNCLCAESNFTTEPLDTDDAFPATAYDLLYRLLEVNPHKRITAEQALQHPFFRESPNNNAVINQHISLSNNATTPNVRLTNVVASNKSAPLIAKK